MAKKIGSETIRVRRAVKVDRLSEAPAGAAPEHDVEDCVVLPRSSNEADKGWTIVEGKMVIAPYGADVTEDDQVRVPDDPHWYEVDGVPGAYKDKRARGKAVIIYLKRQGT